jgi:prepilin-type N-terminal cleavage/methylation domain-containing protein
MASSKQNGFSLLEMIIAISISLILAGVVTVTMQTSFKQQLVNDAYNTTLTTLRQARDQAAADMRVYLVTFATPTAGNGGSITVTDPATGTTLITAHLPPQVTFHLEPGLPNTTATTPDGFGAAGNVFDFDQAPSGAGGGNVIYFQPDGSAQDAAGNVNNGVVYLGTPGQLPTQRAITLWGYTGRIRGWTLVEVAAVWNWVQS